MNLISHAVRSKGRGAFIRRIGSIASRFGLSTGKTDQNLRAYLTTLRNFDCSATFPITAVILARHPGMIRQLSEDGVEFAVHGYIHTDHTLLSQQQQRTQMARALKVFQEAGISATGFRSPYLRGNDDTIAAANSLGFQYVSNEVISYDVLDRSAAKPSRWVDYEKALKLYSARPSCQALARPKMHGDMVEIPVAVPDDEILVDRLGFTSSHDIGRVWTDLVDITHAGGDLLTFQLHPERGSACHDGLAAALETARRKQQTVWVAQLRDIAAWWRRRATYQLKVEPAGPNRWRIAGPTDFDAAILLKNLTSPGASAWYGPYAIMDRGEGVVVCERPPAIGVGLNSKPLQDLLKEEGYAVWTGVEPQRCPLFIDRPGPLTLGEQAEIVKEIERSSAPLVRIGRWPRRVRSAISVTGDIDALTLGDFLLRAWEVR